MEVAPADSEAAPGRARLALSASMKTPKPGFFSFAEESCVFPERPMLLNIDGQTVEIPSCAEEENTWSPDKRNDPENGNGIRYTFNKNLVLAPGKHLIAVAIPGEGVAARHEVLLKERENKLTARPVYLQKRRCCLGPRNGDPSYAEGVATLKLFLNGEPL